MKSSETGDEAAIEHFRRAAERAPIGIICVSGATGRYVFANEAFARMMLRTLDELMSADPYEISVQGTHPDDRLLSRQAMERLAQGGLDTHRYEKRLLRRDGSILWAAVDMLATRDAEGRLAYLTLYFTDIHAQRTADQVRLDLEDQLRHAQKVEALGRLAGGVAHDFNNRLTVIMSYAEILLKQLPETSLLRGHAEQVLVSAQRASDLTRRLLAYGRRQVLNAQVFDLNVVVDRMRHLLERLVGDDVRLLTALGTARPVLADPGQIEQVILNLAINARDAMPRGGVLMLETRDAPAAPASSTLAASEYVELTVRDTGTGISEDILPRIFEPFFTTKEPGRGTGLGLSTVEGIVLQSGGSISVESTVGAGTAFKIVLPRGDVVPKPAPARIPVPLASGLNLETVLVVDDDASVCDMIANVLRLRGYTVLTANHGREALEVAARHDGPVHLLVTDLVMPEQSGTELAEVLRERHPKLRVLYVSGYTSDPKLLANELGPATFFLAKPFVPSELTRIVCSILEAPAQAELTA
jgi:two-component system cell cycle sensor histidine kinase/response regulator CckA